MSGRLGNIPNRTARLVKILPFPVSRPSASSGRRGAWGISASPTPRTKRNRAAPGAAQPSAPESGRRRINWTRLRGDHHFRSRIRRGLYLTCPSCGAARPGPEGVRETLDDLASLERRNRRPGSAATAAKPARRRVSLRAAAARSASCSRTSAIGTSASRSGMESSRWMAPETFLRVRTQSVTVNIWPVDTPSWYSRLGAR